MLQLKPNEFAPNVYVSHLIRSLHVPFMRMLCTDGEENIKRRRRRRRNRRKQRTSDNEVLCETPKQKAKIKTSTPTNIVEEQKSRNINYSLNITKRCLHEYVIRWLLRYVLSSFTLSYRSNFSRLCLLLRHLNLKCIQFIVVGDALPLQQHIDGCAEFRVLFKFLLRTHARIYCICEMSVLY